MKKIKKPIAFFLDQTKLDTYNSSLADFRQSNLKNCQKKLLAIFSQAMFFVKLPKDKIFIERFGKVYFEKKVLMQLIISENSILTIINNKK